MSERYEFFDHTADIGVHVYGSTLSDLFRNAALAMFDALGSLAKGEGRREKSVKLEAGTLEDLLHDWLTELLYEIDANHILYDDIEISHLTTCRLEAALHGAAIDFSRSQTNEEIKAITYHQLQVEQRPDGTWRATVIFDV